MAGSHIKCPLCWTKGAIEALHEGSESYLIGLLEDANLLAIQAMEHYFAAPGYLAGTTYKREQRMELFRVQGLNKLTIFKLMGG